MREPKKSGRRQRAAGFVVLEWDCTRDAELLIEWRGREDGARRNTPKGDGGGS